MYEGIVDLNFTIITKLLGEDIKSISLIKNIASNSIESGFLMKETTRLLMDSNILSNSIKDSNKIALAKMLSTYFDTCYDEVIKVKGLEQLVKFAKLENYKVESLNGLRYATTNEITQGVRGLKAEIQYPLGEDIYKKLCLLAWTVSGNNYFYKEAGFNVEYENGKVKTTVYDMIVTTATSLIELFDWIKNKKEFKEYIKTLRAIKKNGGGHKYSTYAEDEITEEISLKQLVYFINKEFEKGSNDKEYRLALHLAIKGKKNLQYLTPMEICFMRVQYDRHLEEYKTNTKLINTNFELKNKCERLLEARKCRKINQDHFAFKIIKTLGSNGYKSCSQKQLAIIDSALQEYEKELKKVQIIDYSTNKNVVKDNENNTDDVSNNSNNDEFVSDDYFDTMIPDIPNLDLLEYGIGSDLSWNMES